MVSVPIRSSSAVPRNLEIKVRVADLAPARATATRLGARPAGVEVQVDRLGRFLELEAVVDAAHDEAACRRRVAEITAALGLREADFIRASYAELLRCDANLRRRRVGSR